MLYAKRKIRKSRDFHVNEEKITKKFKVIYRVIVNYLTKTSECVSINTFHGAKTLIR